MTTHQKIPLYCQRAIESIEKISQLCNKNVEDFVSKENRIYQSACIMQLINLIEIIKKITHIRPELGKEREVSKMNGLRNIAAHDYMAIDMYIIYDVVKNYLPGLQKNLSILPKK